MLLKEFGKVKVGDIIMKKSAVFSPDRKYRYVLWRNWGTPRGFFELPLSGYAMFIGLNPSTADEFLDDPTVRRCIRYAHDWGYAGLCMVNLFAFRATKPKDMKAVVYPIGTDNDKYLVELSKNAGIIIAAWGTNGDYRQRDEQVVKKLPKLHCLKLTKEGFPAHPLWLPKGLKPFSFSIRRRQK